MDQKLSHRHSVTLPGERPRRVLGSSVSRRGQAGSLGSVLAPARTRPVPSTVSESTLHSDRNVGLVTLPRVCTGNVGVPPAATRQLPALGGRMWPGECGPPGLESQAGLSLAFMFYEGRGTVGCLLIIKAVFMTSPKGNKKGRDPSVSPQARDESLTLSARGGPRGL